MAYLGFGYYNMDHVLYLAPALEVMHSTGGRGLTENYLGLDSSEDGSGSRQERFVLLGHGGDRHPH